MLHQVKKGVWEHLINLTLEIIKSSYDSHQVNLLIHELDLRVHFVPRYSGLKRFPKGISNLSQVTAAEYQQIMRVGYGMLFAIESEISRALLTYIQYFLLPDIHTIYQRPTTII